MNVNYVRSQLNIGAGCFCDFEKFDTINTRVFLLTASTDYDIVARSR